MIDELINKKTQTESSEGDEEIKVTNVYDGTEVKHALDDELAKYLVAKGYPQNDQHTHVKLVLGYLSCFIAAGQFLYERKHGFDNIKYGTLGCVLFFWVLQGASWLYTQVIEKNEVFVTLFYANKIHTGSFAISSIMKKNASDYQLETLYTNELTAKSSRSKKSTSITEFFAEDGTLDTNAFHRYIDVIVDGALAHLHQE
ncbi:microsomal signal peptidase 25 kDa subunit [Hesseltinella vesiculosa]|uniref:Signal peptidase complex subunit 2 n=1 Tax=Hesseltinella vesiculosa TaxID=101127 RepID=A0A1X2GSG8_9FUNG|nr:microsomal signal peptidase 25 kDa subunit [Hesseltinella vesiculosa]